MPNTIPSAYNPSVAVTKFQQVACKDILETPSLDSFQDIERSRRRVSILKRDEQKKEGIKKIITPKKLDILPSFYVAVTQGNEPIFINDPPLPDDLRQEIACMAQSYIRMTGAVQMAVQIGKNFIIPPHTHPYYVLNCNWLDTGTGMDTDEGPKIVSEGDWLFLNPGVYHYSTGKDNKNRITIAVFGANPRPPEI